MPSGSQNFNIYPKTDEIYKLYAWAERVLVWTKNISSFGLFLMVILGQPPINIVPYCKYICKNQTFSQLFGFQPERGGKKIRGTWYDPDTLRYSL